MRSGRTRIVEDTSKGQAVKRILRIGLLALPVALFGLAVGCRRAADEPEPPIDVPAEDLKSLADGNNAFAVDLYKKVAEKQAGNLVLSPYSVSSALAMTYAGAKGPTADEMRTALHFTLPPEKLHPAFGGLTDSLQTAGKKRSYQLDIANALWTQQGMTLVPEFRDTTSRSYHAGVREVDFGRSEATRETINKWVEERTQDRIKDLLKPGSLGADTRMVLTNAIYFKGDWKRGFDKARTHDAEFEKTSGAKSKVRMMWQKGDKETKSRACDTAEWQWLELPYLGDRLSMVFMLPSKRCGLREAEAGLTVAKIQEGLDGLKETGIDIALPRFKFESRFELKPPLTDLGMRKAFDDREADFSSMTPDERLHIAKVIHGGNVEVDEVGTVAAAATHVEVVKMSATISRGFRADHPFLFLIRDANSGNILFIGRVADPEA